MQRTSYRELILCVTTLGLVLLSDSVQAQSATGSAFTYQGRLNDAGNAAGGTYDLQFTLYDSAEKGRAVGQVVSLEDVDVKNGLFTVELDFGKAAFDGKARFLEVAVRSGDDEGEYTSLEPRQPLTAAPYALFALNAATSGNAGSPETRAGAHWGETWTGTGTGLTLGSSDDEGLRGQTDGTGGAGVHGLSTATSVVFAPGVYGESRGDGPDPNTHGSFFPAGVYGEALGANRVVGVMGQSYSSLGFGVLGWTPNSRYDRPGPSYGVWGTDWSGTGAGVHGLGFHNGVSGEIRSDTGTGVYGLASSTLGSNYAVYGENLSSAGTGVYGKATTTSGTTYGVYGESLSSSGTGAYGKATATTGTTYGVVGQSSSDAGRGVYGTATATTGTTYGVYGQSISPAGVGVYGFAPQYGMYAYSNAGSGTTYGLYAVASSTGGQGVYAVSTATTGNTRGVSGQSNSSAGVGVYGTAPQYGVQGASASGRGVFGQATATTGTNYGVYGQSSSASGRGVFGAATASAGTGYGVYGQSSSATGVGVYGTAPVYGIQGISSAVSGNGYGVYAQSASSNGNAVYALATATTGSPIGVSAQATSAPNGIGIVGTGSSYGIWGTAVGSGGNGVYGIASSPNGTSSGVFGQNAATSGRGVSGVATAASGTNFGVYGETASTEGFGVSAYNSTAGVGLYARSFDGNPIEAFGRDSGDRRFYVSNAGDVYADGVYNSNGADFAEMLPASAGLEPGDVLAAGRDGRLTRSTHAFQTSVLGIYSTQPGFLGGAAEASTQVGKAPLAVIGIVPVKASAENGAILPGDLLVASSTPGHVMRAGNSAPPVGTVLGKALQELDKGTGAIRMLVTLQ